MDALAGGGRAAAVTISRHLRPREDLFLPQQNRKAPVEIVSGGRDRGASFAAPAEVGAVRPHAAKDDGQPMARMLAISG